MHDERYKSVFACPHMAEGLLRGFGAPVQPDPEVLAPYRPSQRHRVIDTHHAGIEDLPEKTLVTALILPAPTRPPRRRLTPKDLLMPTTANPSQAEGEVREEYFESHATGVELEVADPPEEPEPWDPEKIRIHTKHYSLRQVVDMIAEGDIDLAPDFQRHYVWKDWQRWGLNDVLDQVPDVPVEAAQGARVPRMHGPIPGGRPGEWATGAKRWGRHWSKESKRSASAPRKMSAGTRES